MMKENTATKHGDANEVMDELLQLVSFMMGDEEFGVDILKVKEIIRMMEITRVPNTAHYIEGVVNLRGRVVPIIDLRKKLGLPTQEHDKNTRIIVVEIREKTVGFIVDSVNEVLRIPMSITEPPPAIIGNVDSKYITAVGKLEDRLLILLDLEKIVAVEKMDFAEA